MNRTPTSSTPCAVVHLCHAKPCRTAKGWRRLRDQLMRAGATVRPVRCQKVCKGPVVGIEVKHKVRWFRKLRGRPQRAALEAAALGLGLTERLRKREARERRGRLRE